MKLRSLFFLAAFVIALFALFRFLSATKLVGEARLRTESLGQTAPSKTITIDPSRSLNTGVHADRQDGEAMKAEQLRQAFSTPIAFYGKVIDQNSSPIPQASVHFSVEDKYFGNGSKGEGKSDVDGFFSITGVSGAGLYISVAKVGYDSEQESHGSFGYGVPTGQRPPTKESPAIFVLRKKADAEPLIAITSRQFEIPKDGNPVGLDIKTAKRVPLQQASFIVESWVNDQDKDAGRHFDWSYQVTVPGGGLIARSQGQFEAPEEGYRERDFFRATKTDARWSDRAEREYFVKLPDNTYARLRFQMMAGGHFNFFVLESYLNPSGSRNLEYDPAKEIKTSN